MWEFPKVGDPDIAQHPMSALGTLAQVACTRLPAAETFQSWVQVLGVEGFRVKRPVFGCSGGFRV